MDLSSIRQSFHDLPAYGDFLKAIRESNDFSLALGLSSSSRAVLASSLAMDSSAPIVYLVSKPERFLSLSEELPAWSPGLQVTQFPAPNPLFYEQAPWGPRTLRQRICTLAELTGNNVSNKNTNMQHASPSVIVAPIRAAMFRTISPQLFRSHSRWLKTGDSIKLDRFLKDLIASGYDPASIVTETGQFNRRGGILDIWSPPEAFPLRIELFGDEIESMRSFDPSTQLSLNPEEEVFVTPAREGLPALFNDDWRDQVASDEEIHSILEYFLPHMNPSASSLFHYLPKESIILLDEKINILDAISEFEGQALEVRESGEKDGSIKKDAPLPYLTLSEILDSFEEHTTIDVGQISSVDLEFHWLGECRCSQSPGTSPGRCLFRDYGTTSGVRGNISSDGKRKCFFCQGSACRRVDPSSIRKNEHPPTYGRGNIRMGSTASTSPSHCSCFSS
jgi:transcription-repair coupling factor (superfamily II helicase)